MFTKRQAAEAESTLPYSFKYKITKAFWGRNCPVCGVAMNNVVDKEMGIVGKDFIPTIQHNVPISKGGRHELGNISVICKRCNVGLRDTETGELNAKEVVEAWQMLNGSK
jgi:5-methylcytosine-specific restriction endonuclease McrA